LTLKETELAVQNYIGERMTGQLLAWQELKENNSYLELVMETLLKHLQQKQAIPGESNL
jgi:hypothetical protein